MRRKAAAGERVIQTEVEATQFPDLMKAAPKERMEKATEPPHTRTTPLDIRYEELIFKALVGEGVELKRRLRGWEIKLLLLFLRT